jgi:uncharacterized protein (DUF2147 family)
MWKVLAGALGLMLMVGAAQASPDGVWELDTRDTRFSLELCGGGSQLCGSLIWLSDDDYNQQYLHLLNTPITAGLEPAGPNRWKGSMRLMGQQISGTITQVDEDHMVLKGCVFLIACKSYGMFRYSP